MEPDAIHGSKDVALAAIRMVLSGTRDEEKLLKAEFRDREILAVAVDFGGNFIDSVAKVVERAVVSAKKEGLIRETHAEEGAVAGAAREAISQIMQKAIGLNIGGKIGVARSGEHICVAMFFGIGLLHLNEISIGVGHRVI